jgi:nucleolar complex protein 3
MAQIPVTKRRRISLPSAPQAEDTSSSALEADPNDVYLARASRWELEQNYEQRPRKLRKQEGEITRLPIKTPEGRIEQFVVPLVTKAEEAESDSGSSEEDNEVEEEQNEQETTPEVSSRQQIIEAKVELARIAGLLNEDPEENVSQ